MCCWCKPGVARVAARPCAVRVGALPSVAHVEQRPSGARAEELRCVADTVVDTVAHTASAAVIMEADGTAPGAVTGAAGGGLMASALAGERHQSGTSGFAGNTGPTGSEWTNAQAAGPRFRGAGDELSATAGALAVAVELHGLAAERGIDRHLGLRLEGGLALLGRLLIGVPAFTTLM